ncbi:SYF2 splicing factor-domain-containing protein [Rhodotorula diobovata]|uniref:Pre-mRNA-splicing factor SYF2 n=1 Tax=Rhodotorula diobovata TaxID=5288 RepID=A0A5C5G235_9BASI|nr:SYF2 splicing factor-domain-containing protein [Rhodotorula diobovata]
MPPRKSARGKKAAAPAEAPAPPPPAPEELDATAPSTSTTAEPAPGTAVDEVDAEQEQQEQIAQEDAAAAEAGGDEEQQPAQAGPSSGATMEDRMAKMKELRQRMGESARANRQDVIAELNTQRASARTLARLERKRAQAEAMGQKERAVETGEDLERTKNWEYSIEDNERWDKKQARKARRADQGFTGACDLLQDLDDFKPDLLAYKKQREGELATSNALVASGSGAGEVGPVIDPNGLYRDANSFVYADHKPTEDQIDRVIGKLNSDLDKRQKRSRKRADEDEGDITWINEKNRQFNRKLQRYYDDVTRETRENFERGTAL